MARPPKQPQEQKDEKEQKIIPSTEVLDSFLNKNKSDHYNFEEEINYKVSSGSLKVDLRTKGGINPGLHRFCGINEGGKTSCALNFMKNFLEGGPKRKGVYIKAEGRLSEEMKERSGIQFVFSAKDWVEGTCFVFETNIYETAVDAMRQLVAKNDEKNLYFFILDSVDGLISKGDLDKDFEDSNKVAGGAVIAANFMKRMSIALAKRGHIAIFISQVRADIKLDPYTKAPVRQTSATGGNALLHFANWILEFEARFIGDRILKNPDDKDSDIIGHFAKVVVKKSPNETTNSIIMYPIKYGRVNGTSVWIEKEVVDLLLIWEFFDKKASWYSATEEFQELLSENGLEPFPKLQGLNAIYAHVETNKDLCNFLINYFKKAINGDEV